MKKTKKDILGFTTAGVGLGVGSAVVAKAGAKAGVSVGGGLASAGRMMPVVGTAVMGSNTLRIVDKYYVKKKKGKRTRRS